MIYLYDDKKYYIMIDNQGGVFGGSRIFEGIEEVLERFIEWGQDDDNIESIKDYTIGDCIELWQIDVKQYNGQDFEGDLSDEDFNYSNNNTQK